MMLISLFEKIYFSPGNSWWGDGRKDPAT